MQTLKYKTIAQNQYPNSLNCLSMKWVVVLSFFANDSEVIIFGYLSLNRMIKGFSSFSARSLLKLRTKGNSEEKL